MADFRNIHTRIWTDSWFCELATEAKLLFIYLFSNPNASVCGMYELPKRNISIDTGISVDRVSAILDTFSAAGKVFYENGIVWVVNLKKYNDAGDSSKVAVRIRKDLDQISDCPLKRRYYEHNQIPYPQFQIPYPEKRSETERRQKETEGEGDKLDPTPTSPADWMTPQMEAQRIIQQVTNLAASPPDQIEKYTELILRLKDQHNSHTVDYLKPFYDDWCGRKTKDGKPYKRTALGWVEWALEGSAPEPAKQQTRRRKPVEVD